MSRKKLLEKIFEKGHMIYRAVYRIAEREDWLQCLRLGHFASADLKREGFIHCSEKHQVLRTAAKYYAGKTDLVLLEIDETQIEQNLKREDLTGKGERFPHIYAAIPIAAVVHHAALLVDSEGRFTLPFDLPFAD